MATAHADTGESVDEILKHLAHYLPAQGPIGVFIHHNTLHAFEDLPFEDAVKAASLMYGSEPYLSEARYLQELENGRITVEDLDDVLASERDAAILPSDLTRTELRRAILLRRRLFRTAPEIRWWLAETGVTDAERNRFETCRRTMLRQPAPASFYTPPRYAEVDSWMIRLCSAFIDQGVSHWAMADREEGLLGCVQDLIAASIIEPFPGARAEAKKQIDADMQAAEVVERCLTRMGVAPRDREAFIKGELFALPGWAGMFSRLEHEPGLIPHEQVPCRLIDYLAVRLMLRVLAGEAGVESAPAADPRDVELECAAALYDVLQALPGGMLMLDSLDRLRVDKLCDEILAFDTFERRRIWHLAFERRHEKMVLGPLAARFKTERSPVTPAKPFAQVFFCLDEREESIRRHLEEIAPDVETHGTAGFYGVAMNYAGIDDATGVSLCPVVVTPRHAVREHAADEAHRTVLEKRRRVRRMWSLWAQSWAQSTQSLLLGWFSTAVLGIFSLFPMFVHILAPRRYGKLMKGLNDLFVPQPKTEVIVTRTDKASHSNVPDDMELGFLLEEKVERVYNTLFPAGLTENFSPIVMILGHGSTSLNNPHGSAYDCGACGGRRGAPNGRVFATIANIPEVREGLRKRGIDVPDSTWFIGGYHDTSTDQIDLFDLDKLPAPLKPTFDKLADALEKARAANALERCRRFESANGITEEAEGLHHVEERAEHLAQPRPECGHATNAVVFVGRRELTRGLFLDRRWFLVSYDHSKDPAGTSLQALMAAGGPVCGGINLEYYFSYIDAVKYGSGSKLPHNIAGLIGVMDGHSSDLRTGLPVQMVEIHEPVRALFVIESPLDKLQEVVGRLPLVERLVKNRWIRVAAIDPATKQIFVLRSTGFERFAHATPATVVPSSRSWYAGRMEHLPVAQIGAAA